MNRKAIIGIALLLLLVLLLWWLQAPSQTVSTKIAETPTLLRQSLSSSRPSVASQSSPAPQNPTVQTARRKEVVEKVIGVLATPISFYGKVVDQNGDPVANANVDYGTIDKFDADGSNYQSSSDTNGDFSIDGIKGAVLTVGVSKKGYYNIHGKSDLAFAYGVGPDSTRKAPPTKTSPALFVLQKMGRSEPLIRVRGHQIDVPTAGQPTSVNLITGQAGSGDLQIESWLGDSSQRRFDWRYRLSIPNGGLVERESQFDFEAPTDGYLSAVEVKIAADAKEWSSDVNKSYFAKMPDGRYARFSINLYPGKRNFVVIESYVNPKSGSRNLEYDPSEQAATP